jgi:hypothetical protein
MIAYAVSVNDRPITVAGESAACVLTAVLTAVGRLGPESTGARVQREGVSITLEVGGLAARHDENPESLNWIRSALGVGDEIRIRIIDVAQAAPPPRRERSEQRVADEQLEDELRAEFEAARDTYLALRSRYEPDPE